MYASNISQQKRYVYSLFPISLFFVGLIFLLSANLFSSHVVSIWFYVSTGLSFDPLVFLLFFLFSFFPTLFLSYFILYYIFLSTRISGKHTYVPEAAFCMKRETKNYNYN